MGDRALGRCRSSSPSLPRAQACSKPATPNLRPAKGGRACGACQGTLLCQ